MSRTAEVRPMMERAVLGDLEQIREQIEAASQEAARLAEEVVILPGVCDLVRSLASELERVSETTRRVMGHVQERLKGNGQEHAFMSGASYALNEELAEAVREARNEG